LADDGFGGVDDVHDAAICTQIVEIEEVFGVDDGQVQTMQGVGAAAGGGDGDS
jgi:hypothetical protein